MIVFIFVMEVVYIFNVACFSLEWEKKDNLSYLFSFSGLNESRLSPQPSSNTKDVSFLRYPGVYEILDNENDLSYYGESDFLGHRPT
jgi:hypothetical protein